MPSSNDDDEDYTPALPPHLAAARRGPAPAPSPPAAPRRTRVIGPALPGTDHPDPDPDSDAEVGPQPLPAASATSAPSGVEVFRLHEERRQKHTAQAASAQPKPVREAWMLVPPSRGDLTATLDPTKLKARQFSRSTRPAGPDAPGSLWTETPAERQQRLADEVTGRKRPALAAAADEDAGSEDAEARKQRRVERDKEVRRGVEEHTRRVRGAALIETHHDRPRRAEDGDGDGDAIWDHARDMALGGRLMDDAARAQIVRDARSLGDRFGKGSRGSFL